MVNFQLLKEISTNIICVSKNYFKYHDISILENLRLPGHDTRVEHIITNYINIVRGRAFVYIRHGDECDKSSSCKSFNFRGR